ncbi:3-mercaptopyruvate sulfurtransferase [Candidatus Njordibacter sp. Uisw_039]|jgi:thiosulfate/3-mercaptopyruvate sulfurtransferase|uniref:3-mercaptopyruvate sulfurtransferase n=1 Tax=Candidatus Njordibacter sp. Uisw_039 TaxID=3230972 RepID=UPI003D38E73C
MLYNDTQAVVSTQWLDTHIEDANLKLLDASWYLPNMQRNAYAEYSASHIPGALFFDIDKICDETSDLPHMAPSIKTFSVCLGAMGISDSHQVVVYDGAGLFSAARVWWLFKLMGLDSVSVLDGGLPKWRAEGRKTDNGIILPERCHIIKCNQRPMMKDATQVAEASKSNDHEIIDARAPGRFSGIDPEPRKGLRSGHIPGSKNLFFKTLLHDDHTMKSSDELCATFLAAGVDISKPVITSCGSGITAAILNLALAQTGKRDHFLYDGSWAEWGMSHSLPVETG